MNKILMKLARLKFSNNKNDLSFNWDNSSLLRKISTDLKATNKGFSEKLNINLKEKGYLN